MTGLDRILLATWDDAVQAHRAREAAADRWAEDPLSDSRVADFRYSQALHASATGRWLDSLPQVKGLYGPSGVSLGY